VCLTSHASRRRIRRHARRRHIRGFDCDSPGLFKCLDTGGQGEDGGVSPRRGFLAAPRCLVRYGTAFAGTISTGIVWDAMLLDQRKKNMSGYVESDGE
jgi:hypothetical protein